MTENTLIVLILDDSDGETFFKSSSQRTLLISQLDMLLVDHIKLHKLTILYFCDLTFCPAAIISARI